MVNVGKREWLILKRWKVNLTQRDIAHMLGVAQPTYSSFECGYTTPSVEIAQKMAEILDFDPTVFDKEREENKKEGA